MYLSLYLCSFSPISTQHRDVPISMYISFYMYLSLYIYMYEYIYIYMIGVPHGCRSVAGSGSPGVQLFVLNDKHNNISNNDNSTY